MVSLLCLLDTMEVLHGDPTIDCQLFAMLARDPYAEVAYIPARYLAPPAKAIEAGPADSSDMVEVTDNATGETTQHRLERAGGIPSPTLLQMRPGKIRRPQPVIREDS